MTLPSNQAIQPRFRTIDGLSIRYAESEDEDGADHALLLGPWPESLFCYVQTWLQLAERAHLVAIDLPGFGHSERRDALMFPQEMGGFIVRVADEFGLENPHVVGPDVGTNAALFAAALNPGRLRSLVVGSGGAGGHDRAVPPANSEFLHRRLPHSKLDILDAGHFTWEDSPDEYAALIARWWTGGYATV